MEYAKITLTTILTLTGIILGIIAALVTIVYGVISLIRWLARRKRALSPDKQTLSSELNKDLSCLWKRLNEVRENAPRETKLYCFKLGFERWDENSNWKGLSEDRRNVFSKKIRGRVDGVAEAFSKYQSALQKLNTICSERLTGLIKKVNPLYSDSPQIMFRELLGVWVDSIIEKGFEPDEIIGWSIAEELITATNVAANMSRGSHLKISKTILATCCSQMIRDIEERESESRQEFRKTEQELKRAVHRTLRFFSQ